VAADTETAAQQEQTEHLAPEFEALGGGAYTAAQSVAVEATDGNEELKPRGGSLSRKGAKAAVQAERSTPINI
jgi:hypothetical protein